MAGGGEGVMHGYEINKSENFPIPIRKVQRPPLMDKSPAAPALLLKRARARANSSCECRRLFSSFRLLKLTLILRNST